MPEQDRQALATEILELGEQLFALALEGRASLQTEVDSSEQQFPIAEIETASGVFFAALSLLMGVD